MRTIRAILRDRALQKSLTWRVIALIVVMAVTLVATGSLAIAGKIGFLDAVFKTILYWLHEKAWEKVDDRDRGRDDRGTEEVPTELEIKVREKRSGSVND